MTRCSSCNGIIAPYDVACYVCGEAIPGRSKRAQRNRPANTGTAANTGTGAETRTSAAPVQLACFASLVLAGWALISGHRLLLYIGLTICSVLLFSRIFGGNKEPKQQKS